MQGKADQVGCIDLLGHEEAAILERECRKECRSLGTNHHERFIQDSCTPQSPVRHDEGVGGANENPTDSQIFAWTAARFTYR
jgi:hypothetical protein